MYYVSIKIFLIRFSDLVLPSLYKVFTYAPVNWNLHPLGPGER